MTEKIIRKKKDENEEIKKRSDEKLEKKWMKVLLQLLIDEEASPSPFALFIWKLFGFNLEAFFILWTLTEVIIYIWW